MQGASFFASALAHVLSFQSPGSYTCVVLAAAMQVYALDKRFLDPRRPLRAKVTPEEAEERLLPYNELIIFSTLQYPTQDKQVSVETQGTKAANTVLCFLRHT